MPKKRIKKNQKKTIIQNEKKFNKLILLLFLCLVLIGLFKIINFYDSNYVHKIDYSNETAKSYPPEVKKKILYTSSSSTFRVPILMYHYVEFVKDKNDTTRQKLNTLPTVFDLQIKTLIDANYTFMTESELSQVLDGKKSLPAKPILITFDDGYRDFYTDVFPILQKYDVHATAYIITGFLGGRNYMDANQIAEIAKSNLVEIGDHTIDHISLKERPKEVVEKEVSASKDQLEKEFGIKVVSFAYPYGSFDQQAADIIKNAGYSSAVTTVPGNAISNSNRFFMPRIRPGGRTGKDLINFLENYKDPTLNP